MSLEKERIQREKEETELRRRNERLRADLLRSISHDLRTPLTSISGNASNLLSSGDNFEEETRHRLYADIYDDSVWLISLVENLLAVSRIEDGTMKLHRKLELLDDIISEALLHIDRRASQYTIIAEPSEETILIEVDGRLIVQVLINLINNAIQYTPPGSTIRISSVNMGDCAKVIVADDGPRAGNPGFRERQRIHDVLQREQKSDGFQAQSRPWTRPVPVHHKGARLRDHAG